MKTLPDQAPVEALQPERGGDVSRNTIDRFKTSIKSSPHWFKRAIRSLLIPPLRSYIRFVPTSFAKSQLWTYFGQHTRWFAKRVRVRTIFGSSMLVDERDMIGEYIYYFGVWEPALSSWITSRLKPGDFFLDIGANVGYFSLLASKIVGRSGGVVAVEAAPHIFDLLARNVRMNAATNIRCANVAAWNREERLTLFTKADVSVGLTTVNPKWAARFGLDSQFEVEAIPLYKILTPREVSAARLIKIDVECAEWEVVAGLMPVLKDCRPDLEIMLELTLGFNESKGRSADTLIEMFRERGFYCYQIGNDYSALSYLSKEGRSAPKRINRLAPAEQADLIFSRIDSDELSS